MIAQLYALYKREVLKLFRSRYMWLMIMAQPVMWIIFFGNSLAGLPSAFLAQFFGVGSYLSYMLPGMASITVMTTGMFSSASLVFDRRMGYLRRVLATPTPKAAVFLAKAFGAATRGLLTVPVILAVGALLGVRYSVNPASLLLWVAALVAAGVGFAALFTALTVNTSDFHAPVVVGNFITMPLMFTSTALFPRQFFPEWLKAISAVNPLTYLTELGRDAVTYGTPPDATAFIYLAAFSAAATAAALVLVERLLTAD
jgi:ABC-2 type transport system permease protein